MQPIKSDAALNDNNFDDDGGADDYRVNNRRQRNRVADSNAMVVGGCDDEDDDDDDEEEEDEREQLNDLRQVSRLRLEDPLARISSARSSDDDDEEDDEENNGYDDINGSGDANVNNRRRNNNSDIGNMHHRSHSNLRSSHQSAQPTMLSHQHLLGGNGPQNHANYLHPSSRFATQPSPSGGRLGSINITGLHQRPANGSSQFTNPLNSGAVSGSKQSNSVRQSHRRQHSQDHPNQHQSRHQSRHHNQHHSSFGGVGGGKSHGMLHAMTLLDDELLHQANGARRRGSRNSLMRMKNTQAAYIENAFIRSVYLIMEDPSSSRLAFVVNITTAVLISLNSLFMCLETLPAVQLEIDFFWFYLQLSMIGLFTVEFIFRFIAHTYSWSAMRSFFTNPLNLIDFCAFMPLYIELWAKGTPKFGIQRISILRLFRLFRLFKVYKYQSMIQVMIIAIQKSFEALVATFLFITTSAIALGTLIYFAERNNEILLGDGQLPINDTNKFENIPNAIWFAIVTISTTGYGDTVPHTAGGKLLAYLVMQTGSLLIALPSIIVGRNYLSVWESMKKFRKSMTQKKGGGNSKSRRHGIGSSGGVHASNAGLAGVGSTTHPMFLTKLAEGGQQLLGAVGLKHPSRLDLASIPMNLLGTLGNTKTAVTDFFQRSFGIQQQQQQQQQPPGSRMLEDIEDRGVAAEEIPTLAAPPSIIASPASQQASPDGGAAAIPTQQYEHKDGVAKSASISLVKPPSSDHDSTKTSSETQGRRRRSKHKRREEAVDELLRESERINRRLRNALRSHYNNKSERTSNSDSGSDSNQSVNSEMGSFQGADEPFI